MNDHEPITPTRRSERVAGSMLVAVVLLVAVPIALVAVSTRRFGSASPLTGVAPVWRWDHDEVRRAVTQPLSDGVLVEVIIRSALCIVWVALAVVVFTTIAEVVHMVRHQGLGLPRVRGIGWAQPLARFVASGLVALGPLSAPAASLATAMAGSSVVEAEQPPEVERRPSLEAREIRGEPSGPSEHVHVVVRGESVYSIAADLAGGDELRTVEIADRILDRNLGSRMPGGAMFTNPAYIEIGWRLIIPNDPAPRTHHDVDRSHVVVAGDTLSSIAATHLGDHDAWPLIWEANADVDMGGGRTFDDPNLILPGWRLAVPDAEPATTDRVAEPGTGGTDQAADEPPETDEPGPTDPVPDWSDDRDATAFPVEVVPTDDDRDVRREAEDVTATARPASPTTTTPPPYAAGPPDAEAPGEESTGPSAPSPLRIEHAALAAAGILGIVAVRRRRRLRSAMPRTRIPPPRPETASVERRLRQADAGERAERVDVAVRASAARLVGTGARLVAVEAALDGTVTVQLTSGAELPAPWEGRDRRWTLPATTPIELLASDARRVGAPCLAFAQIGTTMDGGDLVVDAEACGLLTVVAESTTADAIVAGFALSLAASAHAEVADIISVSLPTDSFLGHRNVRTATTAGHAMELADQATEAIRRDGRSSFELRSVRTGGEVWEPSIVLLTTADLPDDPASLAVEGGQGVGVVMAVTEPLEPSAVGGSIRRGEGSWSFEAFGGTTPFVPIGSTTDDVHEIVHLLGDASEPLEQPDMVDDDQTRVADLTTEEAVQTDHRVIVGLLGPTTIRDAAGRAGQFERSKTVELIAWLVTHRERSTRAAARTALWELDVRDATFANVVSEARRGLARLVPPPEGEEWVGRTLTEDLPLHELVVSDAELVQQRLEAARLQAPDQAIDTLRPAVALIRDIPFAGTSYLWPDAEGITSSLVLLAVSAAAELAGHALAVGDVETVFWATGRGLTVLSGHEELIGLRMRAHARAGDLAGVRQEWEAYERVIVADTWSDGEPAPKLLDLRRELLS